MYLNVLLLLKDEKNLWYESKKKQTKKNKNKNFKIYKKKNKIKIKHYWLHKISNFPVKTLYIHSPTSLLKPVFFIVNEATPLDQDMDSNVPNQTVRKGI